MINKEVIKLLEKNVVFWDNEGEGKIAQIPRADYDQLLTLLKEQPLASDFTKENRDFINDANRDFRANRVAGNCVEDYVRALRELGEACDRLDTSEASRKELKELLTEYGRHSPGCSQEFGSKYHCRCGWGEVEANKQGN